MSEKTEKEIRKSIRNNIINRFQDRKSITPREFVKMVSDISNIVVRPNFQRKRVWSVKACTDLFVTFIRGGSINSGILLWETTLGTCNCPQYTLPSNIETVNEGFDFVKIDVESQSSESLNLKRYSLIDGQQKAIATSLLFNPCGTWDGKVFCMNLIGLNRSNFDNYNTNFDVILINKDDIEDENNKSDKKFYIRTCDIATMKDRDIENFIPESIPLLKIQETNPEEFNKIIEDMRDILYECNRHINEDRTINLNILKNYDYSSAYNEFVKANVTGEALSKEDLIFGKIEGKIPGFRETLEDFKKDCAGYRKKKNTLLPYQSTFSSYNLKTEDILYSVLYMCGLGFGPYYYEITNEDIDNLDRNFVKFKRAIIETFRMLASININAINCKSYNAINTISLYRFGIDKDFSDSDKKNIWKYLMWVSFIDFFGRGHTTNILNSFHKFYNSNKTTFKKKGFNLDFVLREWDFKDEAQKNFLNLSESKIREMVKELNYNEPSRVRGFFCLVLHYIYDKDTYGWRVNDHIDHMQPKNLFIKPDSRDKLIALGVSPVNAALWANPDGSFCNRVGNLHGLNNRKNERKGDDIFEKYYNSLKPNEKSDIDNNNIPFIEGIEYKITNWSNVVEAREKFMADIIINNWDYICNE